MVQDGKRSRGKGAHRRVSCVPTCLHPSVKDPAPAGAAVGGFDAEAVEVDGSGKDQRRIPTHLVVTVNGIIGSAANWRYAAKQFVKKYPEDLVVHCSESNYSSLTFDGVDVMGERLAKEVLSVVESRSELQKISFVGHSLGGLVARYAIGILYTQSDPPEENRDCKTCNCGTQCPEHGRKGRIAGLEPVNFITIATPHLGSGFHKQIPLLCGSPTLEKMAYRISWIAGRTGKHLFLKDHDEGKPPLLLQMVNDYGDLRFMSALQSFDRRVAYSNISYDFIVGWKTSSIRRQHELPKRQNFIKNERYPHIVNEEKPKTANLGHEEFVETIVSQQMTTAEMEEAMIRDLNRVTWERIDVCFRKSKQKLFAHNTIQEGEGEKMLVVEGAMIGSRPPNCKGRCSACGHCEAVQVPLAPIKKQTAPTSSSTTVNSRGDENSSNYKPMNWKCKCGDRILNP